jgi:hypothetical protein
MIVSPSVTLAIDHNLRSRQEPVVSSLSRPDPTLAQYASSVTIIGTPSGIGAAE